MEAKWTRLALTVFFSILFALDVAANSSQMEGSQKPIGVPAIRPVRIPGYLSPTAIPQALTFIPPPPEVGSASFAQDEEISRRNLNLQGTARWKLAAEDAEISSPRIFEAFSCALNAPISVQDTPRLCTLLARSLTDTTRSVRVLKNHYRRLRPYTMNKKPICTPEYQTQMEGNGSYPSSHAAIGWAWALILSEIVPERADAILARGRAFGHSRIVCNVHWNSDVVEGRVLAAGIVARLHADPDFRADLEAAKTEIAQARTKDLKPTRQCLEEVAALGVAVP